MNTTQYYGTEMENFKIPNHCRPGLLRYVTEHTPVGEFLTYLLSNDLKNAALKADDMNAISLVRFMRFLTFCFPDEAWGSSEKVKAWLKEGEKK